MFKKFTHLFGLLSFLIVASVATGVSIWYFGGNTKTEDSIETGQGDESHVYPDNILENYEFGNTKNLNQTYTYIFFPSTLYNEFYHDGYSDPENIFGYNEVVLDDFGNPVTDENGVRYNIVTSEGHNKGINGYTNYYDYLKKELNDDQDSYLTNYGNNEENKNYEVLIQRNSSDDYPTGTRGWGDEYRDYARGTYYVGVEPVDDIYAFNNIDTYAFLKAYEDEGGTHWEKTRTRDDIFGNEVWREYTFKDESFNFSKANEILTPYWLENGQYPSSGDVQYDFSIDLYKDYPDREEAGEIESFVAHLENNTPGLSKETNKNPEREEELEYDEQLQKRRQYRNDRFGFWIDFYDWSASSDNPNNGKREKYNQYTGSRYLPISITVNGNLTPDTMAQILPEVSSSMYDEYFYADFTTSAWTYNDPNGGRDATYKAVKSFNSSDVSTIFDIMQNPALYADKNGVIRLYPQFNNSKGKGQFGTQGRDALKAKFTYVDKNSRDSNLITHKKLTYSAETSVLGSPYGYSLNYAVLSNVELKKDYYENISFIGQITYGTHNWGGDNPPWETQFTVSGEQIKSFIDRYGEGLYTFYFLVGNSSAGRGGNLPDLRNVQNVITNDIDNFPTLYQKNLLTWNSINSGQDYYKYFVNQDNGNSDYGRPIALFIEKVTNLRLVSDIPIIENSDGTPSNNQDWNAIDQNVQQGLLDAHNFIIADNVKTYDKNNDGTHGEEDNILTPYVYFIQNADFRYVNSLYFQIRFSNQYIADSLRIVTDFSDYQNDRTLRDATTLTTKNPHDYVSFNINSKTTMELQSQNSLREFFIQNVEDVGGTNNAKRSGFKLKDYYARGIYDIILVSNGSVTIDKGNGTEITQRVYNMYINRHRNSFIKLFDDNPGTFEYNKDGITGRFVSHKQNKSERVDGEPTDGTYLARADLIWNGQTYLGETLTTASVGTTGSFIDALNNYKDLDSSKTYKIVDAVTHDPVAYYQNGAIYNAHGNTSGNNTLDLFMVLKNYVLYIEELKTTSA